MSSSPSSQETVREVEIKISDLKEVYNFNMQPEDKKGRRTAELEIRGNKAFVNYYQEGHYYPKGHGPEAVIKTRDLIKETPKGADYPAKHVTQREVKENDQRFENRDMDDLYDDEEFNNTVEAWMKESKELFWAGVEFKDEVELEQGGVDKIKVEIIEKEGEEDMS